LKLKGSIVSSFDHRTELQISARLSNKSSGELVNLQGSPHNGFTMSSPPRKLMTELRSIFASCGRSNEPQSLQLYLDGTSLVQREQAISPPAEGPLL
jgi:hypothetical protein